MLNAISFIIGETAILLGRGLLKVLPFLPESLASRPEQLMIIIGFAGQGLFAMRFIIQWLKSEGEGRSVIPLAFWYFSIGGGTSLVFICVMASGSGDYLWAGIGPVYLSAQFVSDLP